LSADDISQIIPQIANRYKYSYEEANEILIDPRNIIGFVKNGGRIMAISIVETRAVQLSDRTEIRFAELTDAITVKEKSSSATTGVGSKVNGSGQGFYRHLSTEMINLLRPEPILIYAESNPEKDSLINTIAIQGREVGGVLPQHAEIDDKLKDLMVTYIRKD
jgi:hypothetical protein